MDPATIEARVERLFKEAKPISKPKNHYLKLATVLILATIPLSVTQTPSSTQIPAPQFKPAIAQAQDPAIKPSVLDETDETLAITINQPGAIFFVVVLIPDSDQVVYYQTVENLLIYS